jgi:hypothetical protein
MEKQNTNHPEYTEDGNQPLNPDLIETNIKRKFSGKNPDRERREAQHNRELYRNLKSQLLNVKTGQCEKLPETAKGAAYCIEFTDPDVSHPLKWFVNKDGEILESSFFQNPVFATVTNLEHLEPGEIAYYKTAVTGEIKAFGRPVTRIIKIDQEARFKMWFLQGKFAGPFAAFWFYLYPTTPEFGFTTELEALKALGLTLDRMQTETGAQIEIRPQPLYISH